MTLKVIQCHKRPPLCQYHASTFVFELILMKVCMNVVIMNTQFLSLNKTFILLRSFVFFTLRPFDVNTTLTFFYTPCNQCKLTHSSKIMRLLLPRSYRFFHNWTKKERKWRPNHTQVRFNTSTLMTTYYHQFSAVVQKDTAFWCYLGKICILFGGDLKPYKKKSQQMNL